MDPANLGVTNSTLTRGLLVKCWQINHGMKCWLQGLACSKVAALSSHQGNHGNVIGQGENISFLGKGMKTGKLRVRLCDGLTLARSASHPKIKMLVRVVSFHGYAHFLFVHPSVSCRIIQFTSATVEMSLWHRGGSNAHECPSEIHRSSKPILLPTDASMQCMHCGAAG